MATLCIFFRNWVMAVSECICIYITDYVPFPLFLTQSFLYVTELKQRGKQEINLCLHRLQTTGSAYLLWEPPPVSKSRLAALHQTIYPRRTSRKATCIHMCHMPSGLQLLPMLN